MNRTQLEHIIRAASRISGDPEIVVVGSQAIHARPGRLPPIAFQSNEADVYPRNHPERAEQIDAAIGELSPFHETYGYYRHGVSPVTATLPVGWERRVARLSNANTGGATGHCVDVHDLVLAKYAAGREKDAKFNRELARHGVVRKQEPLRLVPLMPVDAERKRLILSRIEADFPASSRERGGSTGGGDLRG